MRKIFKCNLWSYCIFIWIDSYYLRVLILLFLDTLQTINSLAVLERCEDIEAVTTAMGEMIEYIIYENNEIVLVENELDYIKGYLYIQKIRYKSLK